MSAPSRLRRRLGVALAAVATATLAFTAVGLPAAASPPHAQAATTNVVTSGDARFEVLSSTLIRTEYAGDSKFVDDATFNAIGRDGFAPVTFTQSTSDGWLTIDTGKVKLKYQVGSGAFGKDNLVATLRAGQQDVVAHPWAGEPSKFNCAVGALCEAENLTLVNEHLATDHSGFTGTGFAAGFDSTGTSVSLRTNVATTGSYDFAVRYADGAGVSRKLSLSIDGGADQVVTFPNTANWDTWGVARFALTLPAGGHTVTLHRTATDDGQINVDSVAVLNTGATYPAPVSAAVDCAFGTVCEGEQATLTGTAKLATDHNGYSGAGFAAELNKGATVTSHVVNVPSAGSYSLQVRYASGVSDRLVTIGVGDATANSVNFAKTSSWDAWQTVAVPVTLAAGANDIKFTCPSTASCGINIDTLAVTATDSALLVGHTPLGGYRRSVDGVNGSALTTPGLLYQDGWYLLNDTPSALYDTATKTVTQRGDHGGQSYQDGYVFGYGHDYEQALTDLATLTGPSELLPRWAYGVWYSEYYDHTADDFEKSIVPKFRSENVPLDVLVSDTDFKSPDPWDGWEIDTSKFPDPKAFFDWAQSQGLHNTMNIHPSILSTDPQFAAAQATAKNALTLNNAGCNFDKSTNPNANCYTFDWADPNQLKAYLDLHQTMETQGVDFWWLDWCCEQSASTLNGVTPDAWINQQYATDTSKNIGRGFAFSRAFGSLQAGGYSGQAAVPTGPWADKRTTVHFTGDSTSSWATLAMEVGYTPGESASTGLSAVSHDIGGFNNDGTQAGGAEPGSTKLPDDLYARWVQLGTFQPIDRLHSNHSDRLPWQYGTDAKNSAEKFLNLRENLVPYTYGLANDAAKTGVPVVRPMYLEYPDQQGAYDTSSSEYLYGADMLVAPVTTSGSTATTSVWFPAGSSWTDWFTGKTYAGGTTANVTTTLDTMPVFVKSGGIIATRTSDVTNDDQNPLTAATVTAVGGDNGSYSLYEDDGDTTDATKSATTPITYAEQGANHTLTIGAAKGSFSGQVANRSWTAQFTNAVEPTSVIVDGAIVASSAWKWDATSRTVTVTVPAKPITSSTTVTYSDSPTLTTVVPKITGTAKVGSTLTVDPGSWAPITPTFTYQWNRNSVPIAGADGKTYAVQAADAGAVLTVTVTGADKGFDSASVISQAVNVASGDLATSLPTITGTTKLGATLTASAGAWGPGAVTLGFQWFRDGIAISGATGPTHVLGVNDVGSRLSVRISGSAAGYGTATTESVLTTKVTAGKLTAATPKVTGKVKVGHKLAVKTGTWKPSGVKFSYRWYRSGKAIKGATKSNYTTVKADKGKTIRVKVTGKKAGYTTVVKTSKATKKVAR